jgi:hypothetical protein
MRLRAVLTIALTCLTVVSAARAADCKSTVNSDLRIHSVTSKIFNNTRSIRVLLYEQGGKHSETDWARRLPDALKFQFGNWTPQPEAADASNQ